MFEWTERIAVRWIENGRLEISANRCRSIPARRGHFLNHVRRDSSYGRISSGGTVKDSTNSNDTLTVKFFHLGVGRLSPE